MRERVGIGGVVAALSVASDLTRGHPPGEAMRACLLAMELARRAGLDRASESEVYYGTLLRFAGCAATSHEIAAAFGGDDIAVRASGDPIDLAVSAEEMRFLADLGVDAGRLQSLPAATSANSIRSSALGSSPSARTDASAAATACCRSAASCSASYCSTDTSTASALR